MPLIEELRRQYPEFRHYSDDELVRFAAPAFGSEEEAAHYLGVTRNEPGFGTTIKRSVGQMAAGLGVPLRDVGWENNPLSRYGERLIAENPSGVNSFEDIADKPWLALREAVAQGLAFVGPQFGLRAVGAGLQAVGAARGIGALSAAGRAAANPWIGGAGVASLPSLETIDQAQRQTGERDPLLKYGGATAVGLIEQLGGPQRLLFRGGEAAAAREASGRPIRTFITRAGRVGLEEAGEELAQNPIEQYAGGQNPADQAQVQDTALSATMGFIGGVVPFGLGSGLHGALRGRLIETKPVGTAPFDLLTSTELPAPPPTPVQLRPPSLGATQPLSPNTVRVAMDVPARVTPGISDIPMTYGQFFRAAGGRVSSVREALDASKTPQQALDIVRSRLEKPNTAQSTVRALEAVHEQIAGESYADYLRGAEVERQSAGESIDDAAQTAKSFNWLRRWLETDDAQRLLPLLSENDQRAAQLFWEHGPEFGSIASELGITRKAAKSRILGQRDGAGELVIDPRYGGPKQVGLVGRLEKLANEHGIPFGSQTIEAAQPQVSDPDPSPRGQAAAARDIIDALSDKDRQVLELVAEHGMDFVKIGEALGITKQSARQRLVGQRDSEGNLVIDPRTGTPRQYGILDHINKAATARGLTVKDLIDAQRIVRESDEARLGLNPQLNESKYEDVGLREEAPVDQESGLIGSPGGSQSNWKDGTARGEQWLRENDPSYGTQAVQNSATPPARPQQGAQSQEANHEYAWAAGEWNDARAASPDPQSIPTFDELDTDRARHVQEFVLEQVKRHSGRLPARSFYTALAMLNEPAYYSLGRAFTDEELSSPGVQRAFRELHESGLRKVLDRLHSITILEDQDSDGLYYASGRKGRITLSAALMKSGDIPQIAHVIRHEVSHEIDRLGGYSLTPELEVTNEGAPVGRIAAELHRLFKKETQVGRYLAYPFDRNEFGYLNALDTQAELFAQIQAAWMSDYGKIMIQREAPMTAVFLRQVNEDAKNQLR